MRPSVLIATLLALTAGAARAQTQAAGLWEHTLQVQSASGEIERAQAQLQQQLATMPPEQRKQLEGLMASRGVQLNPQGTTLKVCIGKEQAARPAQPPLSGDCRQTDLQRSGNTLRYKFACSTPQQVVGESQIAWSGDKSYAGTSQVTSQVDGKPQRMTMTMTGRWLGTDCGAVQPIPATPGS